MSYLRILVNGDGLLERWATLAPDQPRHSPQAREELVDRLTQFYDVSGTPMTIVFDDLDPYDEDEDPADLEAEPPDVQVVFTQKRQRPEQAIERMVRRLRSAGDVLVVGNHEPLPDSVYQGFINDVEETLRDLERKLTALHEKESAQFNSHLE